VVSSTPRRRSCRYTLGKRLWVGWRAGLDAVEKRKIPSSSLKPDRPTRSQSLYRLSYPGYFTHNDACENLFWGFSRFHIFLFLGSTINSSLLYLSSYTFLIITELFGFSGCPVTYLEYLYPHIRANIHIPPKFCFPSSSHRFLLRPLFLCFTSHQIRKHFL